MLNQNDLTAGTESYIEAGLKFLIEHDHYNTNDKMWFRFIGEPIRNFAEFTFGNFSPFFAFAYLVHDLFSCLLDDVSKKKILKNMKRKKVSHHCHINKADSLQFSIIEIKLRFLAYLR